MYYVYILYSQNFNKIHVGSSADVHRRLIWHNSPGNEGWIRSFKSWVVVYTESCNDKPMALIREKQLKSYRGRQFTWEKVKDYSALPDTNDTFCSKNFNIGNSDTVDTFIVFNRDRIMIRFKNNSVVPGNI